MFYLNSYSIDELGIKMRNLFFLIMLISTLAYYIIIQENLTMNYTYIAPLFFIVATLVIFFTRNSFGKKPEDFIKFDISKVIFSITFFIFLITPLLHIIAIKFMPGDLIVQLSISFLVNLLIGYFSFKILLPGDLSRIHATEYRQSAVTIRHLEKENTGKTTPSIKAESQLKITPDIPEEELSLELQVKQETEANIEELLREQEELLRLANQKK